MQSEDNKYFHKDPPLKTVERLTTANYVRSEIPIGDVPKGARIQGKPKRSGGGDADAAGEIAAILQEAGVEESEFSLEGEVINAPNGERTLLVKQTKFKLKKMIGSKMTKTNYDNPVKRNKLGLALAKAFFLKAPKNGNPLPKKVFLTVSKNDVLQHANDEAVKVVS